MRNYGILSLKIILWIIGIVLFLVLLLFVLIRVPAVQDYARGKAVSFLQNKIGTRVEVNRLSLDLPKLVVLEDVYFEDQQGDTLLAGDTLKVDISLMKLLRNTVEINEIDLRGITANIHRNRDSVFNFDYILNAFATQQQQPQPVDTAAAPMKFSIDKVNLDRIRVRYNDVPTANDVDIWLGHFDTRIKEFDLEKMRYNIPKFKLANVNAVIKQGKPAVQPESQAADIAESATPVNYALQLGTADLDRVKLTYRNAVSALNADIDVGRLVVESDKLDMQNQVINLRDINLNNSAFHITLGRKPAARVVAEEAKQEATATTKTWKFTSNNINFQNNKIRFDNNNEPALRRGMDYAHMRVTDLDLNVDDFVYTIDTISGVINSGKMREARSGLNLQRLQANFFYGPTRAQLSNLLLQTDQTLIRNNISASYASIESISRNPGALRIDANLNNTRLGFRDILVFVPDLANTDPFRGNANEVLFINGKVNGQLGNLSIPRLQLSGFRNTKIDATARITGLPDMNRAYFNVTLHDFYTEDDDIQAMVPSGTIPANINIPDAMRLKGTFTGGMTNFRTNLNLNSSYGSARVIGSFSNGAVPSYTGNINTYNFHLGRLLRQEATMGRLSMAVHVDGRGLDANTFSGKVRGRVVRAEYNKYNYRNLNLNATANNGNITAIASMNDPNINFDLNATANMRGKYPSIKGTINVDSLNLQKLNFMQDEFRFRGKVVANLPTADPDYLNGSIELTDAIVVATGNRIPVDSVLLTAASTADSNSIRLRSNFVNATATGKYQLTQVGPAIQSVIYQYFNPSGPPIARNTATPQRLNFSATVANSPIITQFVPGLQEMATITLNGNFNNETGALNVRGNAPRILYNGIDLNNLAFNVSTAQADSGITYNLTLSRMNSGQIQFQNTSINGNIANNLITTDLRVRDANNRDRYRIAGNLESLRSNFEFSLLPNGLVLNYDTWNVSQDNFIRFGNGGFLAQNFVLSSNNQRLSVNSTPASLNSPVNVEFSNFKIETLTEIARKDSLLAGGTINGNALVRNLQSSPVFTSDLVISDFNFRGDTVGNIAMQVNNQTANTLAANVEISGKGNDVDLSGYYYMNNSSFDLSLNIVNLNLKSIEGFTMGNLEDASGSLNGKLSITGTTADPNVNGDVYFNNTAFRIGMFNSLYRINDERITFNEQGIRFNTFTIVDSAGNTAAIDGSLLTQNYMDYRFNLDVSSDNFMALNSTAKDNEMYYGKVLLDSRFRIRGDMDQPHIDGNLKVLPNTNLTVVLPQSDPGIIDREGIVEFVDMDNPENATALTSGVDSLNTSEIIGLDVAANIEVDKDAVFNLIVDQGNGDFLRMRGQAQLAGGIDPSGKITLTGNYILEEGAYELSFNFIRRRFDIRQGSSITWNGEPMMADVNVTAVYVAETPPIDLVVDQLGGASQAELNTYKQDLPFELLLSLKGELMKPLISFDIVLPEGSYPVSEGVTSTVRTRLEQIRAEPSELNKQAFALVLLNRFVSENPFDSNAGGTSAESLARQSVSKLLSEQLNQLAGDLIGGVDLNFDLESTDDYTTGQLKNRTDLNVSLSKRLLNDRLQVSVGNNFELEGPAQPQRETNNVAGNITLDYQLSKDGRYRLRFYRRDQYQVAVEGQVIETGLNFIINMDYNQFRELFQSRRQERKRSQAEKDTKLAGNE
ncbi:translocation/assembly module TamB [Pedobacter sp. SYSU D00535]|uniref:translocation/assembly module TamB domain-containing protein n=1 Tax=Pedobacter sp. SYSU D00535 TaxID=2810308 RepID=UPI001F606A23|nr:translocation/assembly module TamB [Pedobacter sp. SYSU D00535]